MAHKLALFLSVVCLSLCGMMILSCGNSSKNSITTTTCRTVYNVVGGWTLTAGSSSGPGVIDTSGLAVFFQITTTQPAPGDTLVLPTISGNCSFSGTVTAYGTPASGGGSATDTANGNVNSSTSISVTISNGNTYSLVPNSPLSGPVTALSGPTWVGEFEGAAAPMTWNVFLTPNGNNNSMTFNGTGTKPDGSLCHMSGTFTQEGGNVANLNVFDTSITSLDGGCPIGGTATGLGFESNSDYFAMNGNAAGTYLYAMSSTGALVFEIFQPQVK